MIYLFVSNVFGVTGSLFAEELGSLRVEALLVCPDQGAFREEFGGRFRFEIRGFVDIIPPMGEVLELQSFALVGVIDLLDIFSILILALQGYSLKGAECNA